MKAERFDARFDAEDDITAELDLTKACRPGHAHRRVNVDFPVWMVDALDHEARRLGVTRRSVIKMWVADRLDAAGRPDA